jgi:predicted deacylase
MKAFRFIERTSPEGETVSIPHAVVQGRQPGPVMAVVAAVHGSEYTGIEAAIRLYKTLDPDELKGTVRMAIVANRPAFRARTMYACPIDGKNLGASFPGSATGTYSEVLAQAIWTEVVGNAEYVLDLHGGDLIEDLTHYVGFRVTGDQELDQKAKAAALAMRAENVEMRPLPEEDQGLGLHVAGAKAGKLAFLLEAGSQGRRDEEDILFHYHGVQNLMRHAGMLPGESPEPLETVRFLDDFIAVKAGTEGIFYPSVEPNEVVEEGQVIAEIRDFEGEVLEKVRSPANGVILGTITAASTFEGSTLFGLGRLKDANEIRNSNQ